MRVIGVRLSTDTGRPVVEGSWAMSVPSELLAEHLDVYDTRDGLWNPDHGELELPPDWELLPSGDAFMTRRVKASGPYWLAWKPRSRERRHRRLLGVFAPKEAIEAARAAAEETAQQRAKARRHGEASRARAEDRYRDELAAAIKDFLAFDDEHADLAERIAVDASERASAVGSGRVGRTRTLTVGERAELAARACIRHQHTTYEDDLIDQEVWDDEFLYRDVKRAAQVAVDEFLTHHRRNTDLSP